MSLSKGSSSVKNINASNATNVIVIGQTGSGKSTFINALCNYFRGGTLKKMKIAIPTKFLKATEEFKSDEFDIKNTGSSKTDSCINYTFSVGADEFVIIDTPGLSDTRGVDQDEKNLKKIIQAAMDASNLAAIIFVLSGTDTRATASLMNVLVRLKGILPDVILKNILFVMTKCRKYDCAFDMRSLDFARPEEERIFYMNNSAFSTDPRRWDKEAQEDLSAEWNKTMKTIKGMVDYISQMTGTSTTAFKEMNDLRDHIKQTLHDARLKVTQLQGVQDEIAAAEKALGAHGQNAEAFKNYVQQKQVTKMELVDAPYHSTICSTCNNVCHDHCGLEELGKGDTKFSGCAAFGQNNCTRCEKKCGTTTHYHGKKTMKAVTTTLEEILQDVKAKFDAAQAGQQSSKAKINSVQSAKAAIQQAIDSMQSKVIDSCKGLKKICSGFNLVDELYIMLQQLQMEAKSLASSDARHSAEVFIKSIQALCDSLSKSTKSSFTSHTTTSVTSAEDDDYGDDPIFSDSDDDSNNDGNDESPSTDQPNKHHGPHKAKGTSSDGSSSSSVKTPLKWNKDKKNQKTPAPCKHAMKCTRADCKFTHPPEFQRTAGISEGTTSPAIIPDHSSPPRETHDISGKPAASPRKALHPHPKKPAAAKLSSGSPRWMKCVNTSCSQKVGGNSFCGKCGTKQEQ